VFEGRRDGQVKVRGYRIEVGEVERALGQVAGVQASVVVVRTTEGGEKQVVGYVVGAGITASQVRGALQAMVPAYLVPAVIVVVPRLPLTPNGKVDRAALQAMEQAVAVTPESEEAPQGEREEQLAAVWAEVLQRPTVGRHANFFEIGGDSILSMQIIARARRIGILLAPRQLFQYQTIAELATVATLAETTTAEQEPISGPVPLTPIQHWFFEQDLADMHQYNQAMMLACPQAVDAAALAKALQHLVRHHDALRLRFTHDAAGWHQRNAGPEEVASSILTTTDLSGYPDAEQAAQMHLLATNAQASLDLHNGPLLRAVLFHLGASKRARLLIAVHHLAVDAVSWRVLVEDLATAYRQAQAAQPAQLPPKTTSFRRWAEQLAAFAQTPAAIRDLAHWRNPARQQIAPLPVDRSYDPAANTEDSARTVVETLTQEETHDLLQKVPKAYHTHINEVLLAALGATMREWTGSPLTLVDLEGHGRETFLDDIDLSRTVGWFTSIFPVLLDVTEATQPGPLLMTIKEQLRAIPDRGVGYGILRYLRHGDGVAEELRQLPAAEISFNYLGQLDGGPPSEGDFEPTDESTGTAFSPRARRRYLLDILSNVSGGQLRCTWVYSEQVHDQATIANLAQRFGDHLRAIISHCLALESSVHTPSDFPLAHMNAQKLNKLAALLDEEDEKD
jgi:non-ribosomal peptide synthase protein (TIGR01720 family)